MMNTLAMEISIRASQLTPSLTLSIDSKAKAMKSEGLDICGFGAGEPGDEVIIPSPYWVSYPDMVRLAGAEPVIVPTSERNRWKMSAAEFENAMTPRTKMVIMNSPGNPSGSVYSRQELEAIVEVAAEEDIYILSDEIYEKLVYDDAKHVSIASLSKQAYDLTIT